MIFFDDLSNANVIPVSQSLSLVEIEDKENKQFLLNSWGNLSKI